MKIHSLGLFFGIVFLIVLSMSVSALTSWQAQNTNLSISDSLFVNTANGNIGIGNSTPVSRLHVSGNSYFAGDVNITGTLYGGSPVKIGGGIQLVSSSGAPFTCDSTKKGAMYFDSSNNKNYVCDGTIWNEYKGATGSAGTERGYSCTISGTTITCANDPTPVNVQGLTGDASSTRGQSCHVSGTVVSCDGGSSQDVTGATGSTQSTSWIDDTSDVSTNNKVGIGTSSPTAMFTVDTSGGVTIGHSSNTASGSYSVSIGYSTDASGQYSMAFGYDTTAGPGSAAIAMGNQTTASGAASTAMGYSTLASGDYSTAMGFDTTASSSGWSTAFGYQTTASGLFSTAFGYQTTASAGISTAFGRSINAQGANSVGFGLDSTSRTITASNSMVVVGGNFGINTTDPTSTFDVVGSVELFSDYVSSTCDGDHQATDSDIIVVAYAQQWGTGGDRGKIIGCSDASTSLSSVSTCWSYKRAVTSVHASATAQVNAQSIMFAVPKNHHWAVWKEAGFGSAPTCTVQYVKLGQ